MNTQTEERYLVMPVGNPWVRLNPERVAAVLRPCSGSLRRYGGTEAPVDMEWLANPQPRGGARRR